MAKNTRVSRLTDKTSWKMKTLLLGTVLGAVTGLGAAFLLTRRAEERGEPLAITSGEGLRIGVLIAGLLRSILMISDEK